MNSVRDAAQQAIGVMANARDFLEEGHYKDPTEEWNPKQQADELQEALLALRAALAEPVAWMDSDTVIRLAREAGYIPMQFTGIQTLERFAALVAAHEREECAKVCDGLGQDLMAEPEHCATAIRSRT